MTDRSPRSEVGILPVAASDLYDAVTAQLEEEEDGAGYDGDTTTSAALLRIRMAVTAWREAYLGA